MLESRGNLVLLMGGAIIVVGGFLFYVWRQSAGVLPPQTAPGERPTPASLPVNASPTAAAGEDKSFFSNISDAFRQSADRPARPGAGGGGSLFAPPEKLKTALLPPPGRLEDLQKRLLSSRATSTPGLSAKDLRAKYFSLLFPPVYLAYLKANQDFLVSENALKPEEKVEFKNEDEIFAFLKKFEAYLYARRVISEDPAPNFEREVSELQKFHTLEAQLLEAGILKPVRPSSFLNLKKSLASGFRALLGVMAAQAGELGRDDCWRAVGPNAIIGSEERTICCDCGVQLIGKIPVPIPDAIGCKTFGGRCNLMNFGCLNGPGYGGNVIWDSVSKICGFDSPGGFSVFGLISKIFSVFSFLQSFGGISDILGGAGLPDTGPVSNMPVIENLPGLGGTEFSGGIIGNVPGVEPGTEFSTPVIPSLSSGPELISI